MTQIELNEGNRRIDSATSAAVTRFLQRLNGPYAPIDVVLYGSRARGDHTPESDADLAVILKGIRGDRFKAASDLSDIAYDVLLETGVHIQPMPLWEDEWEHPELFTNPRLIAAIRREGLRL